MPGTASWRSRTTCATAASSLWQGTTAAMRYRFAASDIRPPWATPEIDMPVSTRHRTPGYAEVDIGQSIEVRVPRVRRVRVRRTLRTDPSHLVGLGGQLAQHPRQLARGHVDEPHARAG